MGRRRIHVERRDGVAELVDGDEGHVLIDIDPAGLDEHARARRDDAIDDRRRPGDGDFERVERGRPELEAGRDGPEVDLDRDIALDEGIEFDDRDVRAPC